MGGYKFINPDGEFITCVNPEPSLYFPLCNENFKSCITPYLRGDSKIDQSSFLLQPQTRWDIQTSLVSRKIFLKLKGKILRGHNFPSEYLKEEIKVKAGILWHKVIKKFLEYNLVMEILNFVPPREDLEIMEVAIQNNGRKNLDLNILLGIPVYARSAHNIRDHHHVTGLLSRIRKYPFGIINHPTLIFDEKGHRENPYYYFVWCFDQKFKKPKKVFGSYEEFSPNLHIEEPSTLKKVPSLSSYLEGRECVAGFLFPREILKPGSKTKYYILMGITKNPLYPQRILKAYLKPEKIKKSWEENKTFWKDNLDKIQFSTGDKSYDCWLKWVKLQPLLRKIYGNSFLPDFDYGKGGRGWRDLWQDCLGLMYMDASRVKKLIMHNFRGVRIDGSNATIIDYNNNFLPDRNNILRVWSDHGAWPYFVSQFYINLAGDYSLLLKETPYWKDQFILRCQKIDNNPSSKDNLLRDEKGKIYKGTILEHILVENLVQFFNCGPHGFVRLENADWNDAFDMAHQAGETVAFTCLYAYNLRNLSNLLKKLQRKISYIEILEEMRGLVDTNLNLRHYADPYLRRKILEDYLNKTSQKISGKKIKMPLETLIKVLDNKAEFLYRHIRKKEYIRLKNGMGIFNGYYDNRKRAVEGRFNKTVKMTLTGQVFSILSGVAQSFQVPKIFKAIETYLYDRKLGGYRLNTNFQELNLNLGRAFGFSFGDKENGAFFNHMNIMLAFALYQRGFVKQGYKVLNSVWRMSSNSKRSKIYPCIPEYFDSRGQGLYMYLTGSGSWYVFTLINQVFGIKGEDGSLLLEPKFVRENFKRKELICKFVFQGKDLEIIYTNPGKKEFPRYKIRKATLNGRNVGLVQGAKLIIPRKNLKNLRSKSRIEITLG